MKRRAPVASVLCRLFNVLAIIYNKLLVFLCDIGMHRPYTYQPFIPTWSNRFVDGHHIYKLLLLTLPRVIKENSYLFTEVNGYKHTYTLNVVQRYFKNALKICIPVQKCFLMMLNRYLKRLIR